MAGDEREVLPVVDDMVSPRGGAGRKETERDLDFGCGREGRCWED